MQKTELFIVRHGKTMFNTIQRVQGWSDTPLTKQGVEDIHYTGLGLSNINFVESVSSDSGRAIETTRIIMGEQASTKKIPYYTDPRIREWCFGSFEGMYNQELWAMFPRVAKYEETNQVDANTFTFEQIATAIYELDSANWAETYTQLSERVIQGFTDIAKRVQKNGGGKALVVSHGMTIALLLTLIDPNSEMKIDIDNGAVSRIIYENGKFTIEEVASTDYREHGREISKELLK